MSLRDWWREQHPPFLITVGVTFVACVASAFVFGLDRVLHEVFGWLEVAVALPFVIAIVVVGILLLPFLPFLLLSLVFDHDAEIGDVGDGVGENIVGGYFGWIAGRRHPVFWGIPSGLALALIVLAISGYVRDAPKRAAVRAAEQMVHHNEEILAAARAELADAYERNGRYPDTFHEVIDAYGRPVVYRAVTSRSRSSFTLTSQGADPASAADDVCIDGEREHGDASLLKAVGKRLLFGKEPKPVHCPAK